jgi:ketosteroid isomerase-like protein
LYEPDAILMVGGKQVTGHANISAAFHSMLSVGVQMSLTTRSIIESSDGLALLHGEWVIRRAPESQLTTRGLSAEVVRKQPGGTWQFIIDNPYTPVYEQQLA